MTIQEEQFQVQITFTLDFSGEPGMCTRWMTDSVAHKIGDVESNPGPSDATQKIPGCILGVQAYPLDDTYCPTICYHIPI